MKQCTCCFEVKPDSEFSRHKRGGLQSRCKDCHAWEVNRRILSLDMPTVTGKGLHRVIANRPLRSQTDETWEKVGKAFGYWINHKIITAAQAEAIYMHAVEGLSFRDISDLCGCARTTAHESFRSGLRKLQERYHDTFIESDDITAVTG